VRMVSARLTDRCRQMGPDLRGCGGHKRSDICSRKQGAMSARRVSAERLTAMARELNETDRAMVAMLAAVKIASGNQLRRVATGDNSLAGQRAARRQLARLVRWRVIARLERRQGGLGRGSDSWTYALDTAGQRFFDQTGPRRPQTPGRPMWAHALGGAEVYARLAEHVRTSGQSFGWQGEPQCWRTFGGAVGQSIKLKPDAFVTVAAPDFVDLAFVEIDMGSQSRTVIRAKLDAYRRYAATGAEQQTHHVFPLLVFVTTSPDRHALLVDLIGELPTDVWRLFAVGLPDDAVRLLTGGPS
jgi:hypothetical protein